LRLIFLFLALLLAGCGQLDPRPYASWEHAAEGSYAADISADARLSVVSGVQRGVAVWDIHKNEPRFEWSHQGEGNNLVMNVRIAFDNSYVITSDREAFALWNLTSGEPEGFWRIDESSIRDIAVSNQGRAILVGRGNGKVMFFEPKTGRRLEFLGHQEKINSIDLSPNGYYALTGGNDYTAYFWDTRSGQVLYRFTHPSRVTKVVLDAKGRYAFTADSKKQARIWDLQTGEPVSQLKYIQRQRIFSSVRFSENGEYLLTGSPTRKLDLWQVQTGDKIKEWRVTPRKNTRPEGAVVHAVGFYQDGRVMSASSSGLTEVWQY